MILKVAFKYLLLFAAIGSSSQRSTINSPTYKAAVAEFATSSNGSFDERMADSLAGYVDLIKQAGTQDVDILVFPEATLNYYSVPGNAGEAEREKALKYAARMPDPALKVAPCDKNGTERYSELLSVLSCEARSAGLYLVVNLEERAPCTNASQRALKDKRPCAQDGVSLYNANVVFDRQGRVISRYRKFNLFSEPGFNTTLGADLALFGTDFGVKFGQFICFDIMFYEPAIHLVKSGVKDFVFPTMWFSQMPFHTAIQEQDNWSYENDVNLLASGASAPGHGSGGSGIYAGRSGPVVFSMDPGSNVRKLLVAQIKKKEFKEDGHSHGSHDHGSHDHGSHDHGSHSHGDHDDELPMIPRENYSPEAMDSFKLLAENLTEYTSERLNFGDFTKKICHGKKLCCNFDFKTSELPVQQGKLSYEYRAVVYSGARHWADKEGQILTCAVISCAGPDITDCGKKFPDSNMVATRMRINQARVTGDFPTGEYVSVVGTSLTQSLAPLSRERVHVHRTTGGILSGNDVTSQAQAVLDKDTVRWSAHLHGPPVDDLHAFGLYARDYSGEPGTKSSASTNPTTNSFIVIMLASIYFCTKYR